MKWFRRKGKTALNRALVLSEIERAAIAGQEGAIALRQQIANIHQRLGSVGQQMTAVDRLTDQDVQICALPEAVVHAPPA